MDFCPTKHSPWPTAACRQQLCRALFHKSSVALSLILYTEKSWAMSLQVSSPNCSVSSVSAMSNEQQACGPQQGQLYLQAARPCDTTKFVWTEKVEVTARVTVKVISFSLGSCEMEVIAKYPSSEEKSSFPLMALSLSDWAKLEDLNSMGGKGGWETVALSQILCGSSSVESSKHLLIQFYTQKG